MRTTRVSRTFYPSLALLPALSLIDRSMEQARGYGLDFLGSTRASGSDLPTEHGHHLVPLPPVASLLLAWGCRKGSIAPECLDQWALRGEVGLALCQHPGGQLLYLCPRLSPHTYDIHNVRVSATHTLPDRPKECWGRRLPMLMPMPAKLLLSLPTA